MLKPPDTFHLSAAIGWLELGNLDEAELDLEKISLPCRSHEDVLTVRFNIHSARQDWAGAESIAQLLLQKQPGDAGHWINLAYAIRRKRGGGIPEAKEILLRAEQLFPGKWLIRYNLACYESQLGNLAQAKDWFEKACRLGNRKQVEKMATEDPDLASLRKILSLRS